MGLITQIIVSDNRTASNDNYKFCFLYLWFNLISHIQNKIDFNTFAGTIHCGWSHPLQTFLVSASVVYTTYNFCECFLNIFSSAVLKSLRRIVVHCVGLHNEAYSSGHFIFTFVLSPGIDLRYVWFSKGKVDISFASATSICTKLDDFLILLKV
jgi:hypothetical protein